MENYMICNCKKVSYADISNALHTIKSFDDVLVAFEDVQKIIAPQDVEDVTTRFLM